MQPSPPPSPSISVSEPRRATLSTTKLKYTGTVSPVDLRTLPGMRDSGLHAVITGQIVEVPDDLVGEAPFWRPLGDGEVRVPYRAYRVEGNSTEVHDLGSGLLSQVGNWVKATGPKSSKPDEKKGA